MANEDEGGSKEFSPSPQKLLRAREQGEFVRSDDLQASLGLAGFLAVTALFGGGLAYGFARHAQIFLDQPEWMSLGAGAEIFARVGAMILPSILFFIVPAASVLIWLVAARAYAFAPSKLAMKGSRLSILSNVKQKFGPVGLMDFAKKVTKMLIVASIVGLFLAQRKDEIIITFFYPPRQISEVMGQVLIDFLWLFLCASLLLGGLDYLWQRQVFLTRQRMSRKEMTDEHRESEGDPQMKADRLRRAQEIATHQMVAEVATADVVIVNPSHYAVALTWHRDQRRAPVCVAKGVDDRAAQIRQAAIDAGVPIRRDPATARLLYAVLPVGSEIKKEHYAAVAAAIRFSDKMRQKARRKIWSK